MAMEHSATAHMIALYDSSVPVSNDPYISWNVLHDTSCVVNFAMYVDLTIDVTPALRSSQLSLLFDQAMHELTVFPDSWRHMHRSSLRYAFAASKGSSTATQQEKDP